jgi:hypothetical protein
MREGPLAELFRATEAAQKQDEQAGGSQKPPPSDEPLEQTVEHVPTWEESVENVVAPPEPTEPAKPAKGQSQPMPAPNRAASVAQYSAARGGARILAPRGVPRHAWPSSASSAARG